MPHPDRSPKSKCAGSRITDPRACATRHAQSMPLDAEITSAVRHHVRQESSAVSVLSTIVRFIHLPHHVWQSTLTWRRICLCCVPCACAGTHSLAHPNTDGETGEDASLVCAWIWEAAYRTMGCTTSYSWIHCLIRASSFLRTMTSSAGSLGDGARKS